MRFLLEFVTCCYGFAVPRSPASMTSSPLKDFFDERRSLGSLPPHSRPRRRRRPRGRLHAAHDWKPSLCSIYEEDVVPQRCDSIRSQRRGKRKSADAAAVLHYRINNLHYVFRQPGVSTFSPTPFMF